MQVSSSALGQRWLPRIESVQQERLAVAISQQTGLPEIVARILVGRGIAPEEVHDFLHPTLKAYLPDPAHLQGMSAALARIQKAIIAHENIAIFGDYDVDGATSSALLKRYFAALGVPVIIYIPDRMKEGYGPNIAAFETLAEQKATLILTVDCGTVSFDPVAAIKLKGVDVIVIDHHQALAMLPDAVSVINPNRIDQESDCRHLAAVGVVFLLLVALNRALREQGFFKTHSEPNLLQWLDLVALGTICDVMPLTGLNRAFVSQGLKVMAQRGNAGIAAIADVAHLDEAPTPYHVGFMIGPRINAGGRVGESALGSQILSQDDPDFCREMALRLDQYNAERQAIETSVLDAAMKQAELQANQPCILVHSQGWHEGVIGIVAGRLKEQFQRPALVVSVHGEMGKGSARSVTGIDMGSLVARARELGYLIAGGGHAMAAGFSLHPEQISAFTDFLHEQMAKSLAEYVSSRAFLYDGMLSVGGANMELYQLLEQAGPYGIGNPMPRFIIPSATITRVDRMKEKHLRAYIADTSSKRTLVAVTFNAIGTPLGTLIEQHVGQKLHLAGTLKRNLWQGIQNMQFMLEDAALA